MKRTRAPSAATLSVLETMALQPHAERYGYELMKTIGLSSGTLYPILMRLSDRGLLTAQWRPSAETGKPPRQVYRLTNAGIQYATDALANTQSAPVARPKGATS